jgi:hypothetical protein
MKTAFPFFILALANALPEPQSNEETRNKYVDTGKSWKVEATANGKSSGVVIHMLQSQVFRDRGRDSLFAVEGEFPTPNDFEKKGKVIGRDIVFTYTLSQAAYCPKSGRECIEGNEGEIWTAWQIEAKRGLPVFDGKV